MEFDSIRYLHGCLENERGRLQHLISAAKCGNQPLDNSIIKGQEEKISNLEIKIKKLESENE